MTLRLRMRETGLAGKRGFPRSPRRRYLTQYVVVRELRFCQHRDLESRNFPALPAARKISFVPIAVDWIGRRTSRLGDE